MENYLSSVTKVMAIGRKGGDNSSVKNDNLYLFDYQFIEMQNFVSLRRGVKTGILVSKQEKYGRNAGL